MDYKIRKTLLNNIFYNYRNLYNLHTTLKFGDYNGCYFNYLSNTIEYDIKWAVYVNIRGYTEKYNIKEICIFTLLHEIKHAIDYTINSAKLLKEANSIDRNRYQLDFNYCMNLPIEKRANNFAKREINKKEKNNVKMV